MAGHGPVLSSKQLGRLGGGLPAVLGRVLLCCRQPALKVLQLALKVLYGRLKVWGRVFVGVQTLTLLLQPLTHDAHALANAPAHKLDVD